MTVRDQVSTFNQARSVRPRAQKVTGRARNASVPINISHPRPIPGLRRRSCPGSSLGQERLVRTSMISHLRHTLSVGQLYTVAVQRYRGIGLTVYLQLERDRTTGREPTHQINGRLTRMPAPASKYPPCRAGCWNTRPKRV